LDAALLLLSFPEFLVACKLAPVFERTLLQHLKELALVLIFTHTTAKFRKHCCNRVASAVLQQE
jgi:hypothetical protein